MDRLAAELWQRVATLTPEGRALPIPATLADAERQVKTGRKADF